VEFHKESQLSLQGGLVQLKHAARPSHTASQKGGAAFATNQAQNLSGFLNPHENRA